MTKLNKYFEGYLPTSRELDLSLLPTWQALLIQNMAELLEGTPINSILSAINVKCAQMLQFNRVRLAIPQEETVIFPNYYGLTFMDSGSGKDKTFRLLDDFVFKKPLDALLAEIDQIHTRWRSETYAEAEKKVTNKEKNKVYEDNFRNLLLEMRSATLEGLIENQANYKKAGVGGSFVIIPEFTDFFCSENERRRSFLQGIVEGYEGKMIANATKTDLKTSIVTDVSLNFFAYSSIAGLNKSKYKDSLLTVLNRGLARRAFICFPQQEEYGQITDDIDLVEELNKANLLQEKYQALKGYDSIFFDVYKYHNKFSSISYKITEEAYLMYLIYKKYCQIKANELDRFEHEGLKGEIRNRYWKTIKLAGLIASFSHHEILEINKLDLLQAIYQAELFGMYYSLFYYQESITDAEMLYNFIYKRKEVTKMDVRKQNFIHPKNFKRWFDENIMAAQEVAQENGYLIHEIGNGAIGKKYVLKVIENETVESVKISISKDITKDYIVKTILWQDLHQLVNSELQYSASSFKDGYRKNDNYLSYNNIIILDYDDGLTIEDAFKVFGSYQNLITTTKNHQKYKNNICCDRFRVFLPVVDPIDIKNPSEFRTMMKNIVDKFGNKADTNALDAARFYYGNPEGFHYYNDGMAFDWKPFRPASQNEPAPVKSTVVGVGAKSSFEKIKDSQDYDGFEPLASLVGDPKLDKILGVDQISHGNRNNHLHRILRWLKDAGISYGQIENEIIRIANLPHIYSEDLVKKDLPKLFRHHLR